MSAFNIAASTLVVAFAAHGTTHGGEPVATPVEKQLEALWTKQQHIESAHVEFLWFQMPSGLRPLALAEVEQLFEGVDLEGDPALFDKIVPKLLVELDPNVPIRFWRKSLWQQGGEWRDETPEILLVGNAETVVHEDNDNRQIDVHPIQSSPWAGLRLDELRLSPSPAVLESATLQAHPSFVEIVQTRGQWTASMSIDRETGMPLRFLVEDTVSGEPAIHRIQRTPLHSDGVTIPKVTIESRYKAGKLVGLKVGIVQKVRFNLPLDPLLFRVAADRGDVVVDHRGPRQAIHRANQRIRDVVAANLYR